MLQALVQVFGMVIGFFIVRKLSIQEYAYYTIANTILGMLTVISDCGISTSVYAQGAKVWLDKKKLGAVVRTGIVFRKNFAALSIALSFPILSYMLFKQGATWSSIFLISITLIPSFKSTLTDTLYEVVPKLHQDLRALQINQLLVSILRLFLIGIGLFLFPYTWIALLSNGIPRIYGNLKLRKIVEKNADLSQPVDNLVKKETIRIVKRIAPSSIYFAFSTQISLFILSYLGVTNSIAEWGALGRYSILFVLFASIINIVLIPRYARMKNDYKPLLFFAHKIIFFAIVILIIIYVLSYFFSTQMLWILGEKYVNLHDALLLIILNSGFAFVSNTCHSLNICKGWVINSIVYLLLNIIPLIFFALILNLSSFEEVLMYNLFIQICYFLAHYLILNTQLYLKTANSNDLL